MAKMVMLGPTLDPHACFLLQRGLATLALRVRQQCASALALAQFLETHPQVPLEHGFGNAHAAPGLGMMAPPLQAVLWVLMHARAIRGV